MSHLSDDDDFDGYIDGDIKDEDGDGDDGNGNDSENGGDGQDYEMMVMSNTVTIEALRFRNILDNLVAQLFVTDAMLDKNYMHMCKYCYYYPVDITVFSYSRSVQYHTTLHGTGVIAWVLLHRPRGYAVSWETSCTDAH